ncbi:jg452 [Pararge aegeria aegeria]|uniref:Jg452 protein n=1 Tax=Pararge aegeria aegeria TaxID=348720 RepID=A0A8S4QBU5_9NEOP|nr:jg452 [Pararge aegeria aegeria]
MNPRPWAQKVGSLPNSPLSRRIYRLIKKKKPNNCYGVSATASDAASSSQPLRHFGSQIKLDLSVLPIGTSKRNQSKTLPNMKPRKPLIKLPSLSEDLDSNSEQTTAPSTSNQSPRTKSQSTMAKIRGITNEIRHLSNLSKNFEGKLKRMANTEQEEVEAKKLKTD